MRKAILGCLTASLLFLSGCIGMSPDGPASATVNGQTFRTGFYGTLFPHQWETGENVFTVKGTEFHEVLHGTFSLYHADIGPYTNGTIYCREDQYEEACRYYKNPEHYSYYCIIGVNSDDTTEQTILLEDVDPARFDALLDFADNAEYLPFDQKNPATVETVELPMPDHKTTQRLIFYKESCDSLFLSSRGHKYYILIWNPECHNAFTKIRDRSTDLCVSLPDFSFLFVLFRFCHTCECHVISVISKIKGAVDAADRRRRSFCLFGNFQIGLPFPEHLRNFKPLGKRQQLIHRAHILKEGITLVHVPQCQHCLEQLVHLCTFQLFIHFHSPSRDLAQKSLLL